MKKQIFASFQKLTLAAAMVSSLSLTGCESKKPADMERKARDQASPSSEANPIDAESPTPDSSNLVEAKPEE